MKLRIIAFAVTVLVLAAGANQEASAQRYRGCRGGYCRAHVRVWAPLPVVVPPVVVGGYYGPRYYGPAYYGPRNYPRPYYGGYRHYGRRYYR